MSIQESYNNDMFPQDRASGTEEKKRMFELRLCEQIAYEYVECVRLIHYKYAYVHRCMCMHSGLGKCAHTLESDRGCEWNT